MSSEGCDAHLVGYTSARCRLKWHLFFNLNLLGRVWEPTADYNGCLAHFKFLKVRQTAITIYII
jgi:hypothetical protein